MGERRAHMCRQIGFCGRDQILRLLNFRRSTPTSTGWMIEAFLFRAFLQAPAFDNVNHGTGYELRVPLGSNLFSSTASFTLWLGLLRALSVTGLAMVRKGEWGSSSGGVSSERAKGDFRQVCGSAAGVCHARTMADSHRRNRSAWAIDVTYAPHRYKVCRKPSESVVRQQVAAYVSGKHQPVRRGIFLAPSGSEFKVVGTHVGAFYSLGRGCATVTPSPASLDVYSLTISPGRCGQRAGLCFAGFVLVVSSLVAAAHGKIQSSCERSNSFLLYCWNFRLQLYTSHTSQARCGVSPTQDQKVRDRVVHLKNRLSSATVVFDDECGTRARFEIGGSMTTKDFAHNTILVDNYLPFASLVLVFSTKSIIVVSSLARRKCLRKCDARPAHLGGKRSRKKPERHGLVEKRLD
eukprot:1968772-Pleurochrysis_carterae.AAC.3